MYEDFEKDLHKKRTVKKLARIWLATSQAWMEILASSYSASMTEVMADNALTIDK